MKCPFKILCSDSIFVILFLSFWCNFLICIFNANLNSDPFSTCGSGFIVFYIIECPKCSTPFREEHSDYRRSLLYFSRQNIKLLKNLTFLIFSFLSPILSLLSPDSEYGEGSGSGNLNIYGSMVI